MPTVRDRFHLVKAGGSSGTLSHTHTHTHTQSLHASLSHTLVISSSPPSSSASFAASLELRRWCSREEWVLEGSSAGGGARDEGRVVVLPLKNKSADVAPPPEQIPSSPNPSDASVVAFFALSLSLMCQYAHMLRLLPPPALSPLSLSLLSALPLCGGVSRRQTLLAMNGGTVIALPPSLPLLPPSLVSVRRHSLARSDQNKRGCSLPHTHRAICGWCFVLM